MQEWIADELATLDLGDVRLDQRCHAVLDRLSAKPSVSIPAACVGLAEIAATYRFFDNDRVDDSELLHPHRDATVARIRQGVSSSFLKTPPNSTTLAPKKWSPAAGPLTSEARLGFHNHVHLALTPQRLCLGWSMPTSGDATWTTSASDSTRRVSRLEQGKLSVAARLSSGLRNCRTCFHHSDRQYFGRRRGYLRVLPGLVA